MDYKDANTALLLGDCLERMKEIPDGSVDMVLCDPPYGTTAADWDKVIGFRAMWGELERVTKPHRCIALNASQPFTTMLAASNMQNFKYCWYWDKKFAGNFVQAKRMPLKVVEEVLIFSYGGKHPTYFPKMEKRDKPIMKGGNKQSEAIPIRQTEAAASFGAGRKVYDEKHPTTLLTFNVREGRGLHPTQKPVSLMEYMVETYTEIGETVLDFTMGSGTTGVAAKKLGRKFIGIELSGKYFEVAKNRITNESHGENI
jgi:site-specific DNA-methyltransferase (adenine-specific)